MSELQQLPTCTPVDVTKLPTRDGFTVRVAIRSDLQAVRSVVNSAYSVERDSDEFKFKHTERFTNDEEPLSHMYFGNQPPPGHKGAFLVLIKQESQRVVGCIHIESDETNPDTTAQFGPLAVDPALQGQGLGTYLVRVAESVAQQWGCTHLGLRTANVRTDLLQFYPRLGFQLVGTAPFVQVERITRPVHFILMSKALGG
ncbi:hypothetical protein CAOG_01701 [Capsaspora owczarzaki ATCC 30864]|uniref:N-acetyltransferase domain-containing protein n=1 Tax=Capsaspora owczarzaki (strain ATCC 30864) TaxID=595528 RepID=A0A0D2VK38_CAPO3|nr:hypothetical protein CAOG_01701 [Capsaspora owczarzaki ATCC 30864]KJE90382.1 hypothetical protein CAOG_001701 [Capsaspora owczarzaki ATCC 30864]|eukprot:XP_004364569.1 hypothetical protein CAOG_01701 [Capsaspora owczarzaki ATCC 30864]